MGIVRISSADDSRLVAYRSLTDRQLRDRLEPASGVLIAESEKVVRVALAAGLTPISMLIEDRWLEQRASLVETVLATGRSADICVHAGHVAIKERLGEPDVYVLPHEQASRLVGYNVTRGVLCALHRPQQRTASELLTSLTCARRLAVLEAVTDATNVGAVFRSAAALGIDAVLLTPTCCDPLVRRALRVSMGTVFQLPWGRFGTWPGNEAACAHDGLALLRLHGFTTAALALCDDAYELGDTRLRGIDRIALVFGTEGDGLADATISACDLTIKIPMHHGVDSLNVAAASAVAFWELGQASGTDGAREHAGT